MGACISGPKQTPAEIKAKREEKIRSKWIDQGLGKDKKTDRESIKLLFLGAGESGKSTLLKQMTIINGHGFSEEERLQFVPLIHSNILTSIKTLIKENYGFVNSNIQFVDQFRMSPEADAAARRLEVLRFDDSLSDSVVNDIRTVWADPGILNTYEQRSAFQLSDSAKYFLDRVFDASRPGYMPTEQDILRARVRTTGIVEHKFTIDKNDFRMYDVGGQRSARKKWIHCFEKVTSVIFVAAISAYDQGLYEDPKMNALHEALNLFEDICDSRWFVKTSIILFLNKKDIFREKIKKVPLTVCFPDYKGPANDYRAACAYIKSEFKARNHQQEKRIYTHFTCATDTSNIRRVFDIVKVIIVRTHLIEVGLMDANQDFEDAQRRSADYDTDDRKEDDSEDHPYP